MKSFILTVLLSFCVSLYAQNEGCVCCDSRHQAFDFWLGTWEVSDKNGKSVGRNHIEKKEGGCLIEERYSSVTSEFSGRSFNFYNSLLNKWEQLWVDNQGAFLHLSGNMVDGAMVLEGKQQHGKHIRHDRISWSKLEDGRVLQLWEQRQGQDGWKVVFEGYYSKTDAP